MTTNELFNTLWKNYSNQNSSALKIHDLFIEKGEVVQNDHIALRTFDDSRVNIDVISKLFIEVGYKEVEEYHIKDKKLYAKHFEHKTDKGAPLVFISQLILKEFSESFQKIINKTLDSVDLNTFDDNHLIFKGRVWEKPSFKIYNDLRNESEYGAWLYVHGFGANHFTVSVNKLNKYGALTEVNELLKQNGFQLNSSGGEIKGSPEIFLEQSSTLADIIPVDFKEGTHNVPACYYEFAKRYKNKNGVLFKGFAAQSANKIFESTNYYTKQ